jgi:hypothetical protein
LVGLLTAVAVWPWLCFSTLVVCRYFGWWEDNITLQAIAVTLLCYGLSLLQGMALGVLAAIIVFLAVAGRMSGYVSGDEAAFPVQAGAGTECYRVLLILTTWLGTMLVPYGVLMSLFSVSRAFPGMDFGRSWWMLAISFLGVLPLAVLEWRRPRWGAAGLIAISFLAGEYCIRAGWVPQHFRNDDVRVLIMLCFALPMLVLGTALALTARRQYRLCTLVCMVLLVALGCGRLAAVYESIHSDRDRPDFGAANGRCARVPRAGCT